MRVAYYREGITESQVVRVRRPFAGHRQHPPPLDRCVVTSCSCVASEILSPKTNKVRPRVSYKE